MPDQIEIFKYFLRFALKSKRIITIHCVYEWDKLFKVLNSFDLAPIEDKIILHSFQGKPKHVLKFSEIGCLFSISPGCFVPKNFEMLKQIPSERLLLESDAPSMFNPNIYSESTEYSDYPEKEGKIQNLPCSTENLLSKLEELRGETLSETVEENSFKLINNV